MKHKYAKVETMPQVTGRLIIVGDVHGCLAQLRELLSSVSFTEGEDSLVAVGDLVNKGPDSVGVVRLLRRLGARSVLGNHDAKLLKLRKKLREHEALPEKDRKSSLAPLAMSLPQDVDDYLLSLPHILRIPAYNLIVVHAGLHPQRPIDRQDAAEVTTMRNLIPRAGGDYTAAEETRDGVAWASLWRGPETVVFGHDARRKVQRHPRAIGLDSRCVYGGELTAVVYPGERLVSVPGWKEAASKFMFSVCFVTAPSMTVARDLARHLVAQKKVACVNIVPAVTSVYEWEGRVQEETECLMMMKTQTSLVGDVITEVKQQHPYDVPEVISVHVAEGSEEYLKWVAANTTPATPTTMTS